jgi:hypothetical protein
VNVTNTHEGAEAEHHSLFTLALVQAVVSFMPWLLYAGEQALSPHQKGGCMGPRARLDILETEKSHDPAGN